MQTHLTKICTRCSNSLPLGEFSLHSNRRLRRACKSCEREWGSAHRAKVKAEVKLDGILRCSRCLEEKPSAEYAKDRGSRRGYKAYCKPCAKAYQQSPAGRLSQRKNIVKHNYGLAWDEYLSLLEKQGHACKVCRKPLEPRGRDTTIDHCHSTGVVRGVLCRGCNTALGLVNDDPDIMRKLATYVEEAEANPAAPGKPI